jgi:hypothetical protein
VASDRRLKKDIRPYTDGLEIVKRIEPVWYRYNGKGGFRADGKAYIGVVAQDVAQAMPYTVDSYRAKIEPGDSKDTDLYTFSAHALSFALVNAVKDLDRTLAAERRNSLDLELRLSTMEAPAARTSASATTQSAGPALDTQGQRGQTVLQDLEAETDSLLRRNLALERRVASLEAALAALHGKAPASRTTLDTLGLDARTLALTSLALVIGLALRRRAARRRFPQ